MKKNLVENCVRKRIKFKFVTWTYNLGNLGLAVFTNLATFCCL